MSTRNPPNVKDILRYIDDYWHLLEIDANGLVHNAEQLLIPSDSAAIFQYQIIVQQLKLHYFPNLSAILLNDGTSLNFKQERWSADGILLPPFPPNQQDVVSILVSYQGNQLRLNHQFWVEGIEYLHFYSKLPFIYHFRFLIPYLREHSFKLMKGLILNNGSKVTNQLVVINNNIHTDFGYLLDD